MRLYTSIAFVIIVHISLLIALQAGTKTIYIQDTPIMSGVLLPTAPAEIVEISKSRAAPKPLKQKKKPEPKDKPAPAKETISQAEEIERIEESSKKEVVESGATIEPPRVDATLYNNPAPAYPSISRRLNESGIVLLEVLIDAEGRVAEIKLKKSSGYARLDKTALRAVKRWRYVAAKQGNKNIVYWYTQPIRFSLKH